MSASPWPELRAEELLAKLSDSNVDFVVIGGMARTLLGSPRITKDLDVSYSRDRSNLEALGKVLISLNARLRGVPEGLPFVPDERTLDGVSLLTLETDSGWLDLLLDPDGSPGYAELRANAARVDIDGRVVRVASIDDLVAMKRAAGRPQDLADIAELEVLRQMGLEPPPASNRLPADPDQEEE